ncbi:MAG: DUF1343 domain-containing protein [Puniceicoccales bacterium]|jgi:uncharacterized protein YbbC (DUF1343 family)|nr:DUF1343 domain-containing protein [Puniceicoccales bacterium]
MKAIKSLSFGGIIILLTISILVFKFFLHKDVLIQERSPTVKLGIDVLQERNFDLIQGKKIGILTNQAGVSQSGKRTWEILKNTPGVELKAIFAPVHGLSGKYMFLETFYNDEVDGIPIYSVYASNSKPKPEWLRGLDAVVIDLQGIGIRYYNYWAFMVYMMAACFEENIEVIVLDRPNPLGGKYVGGPIMEAKNTSVWGPIEGLPLFHGLTIGELAQWIKSSDKDIIVHQQIETGVIHSGLTLSKEILNKGKLTVVPMKGWKRNMLWQHTGLAWIQTSPMIPNLRSTYEFALCVFGLFASSNHGFDNCNFFKVEADWIKNLPFHKISSKFLTPGHFIQYVYEVCPGHPTGYSLSTSRKNKSILKLEVKDIRKVSPAMFGLALLSLSQKHSRFYFYSDENCGFVGAQLGDSELVDKLFRVERIDPFYFQSKWEASALQFIEKVKSFYLYE